MRDVPVPWGTQNFGRHDCLSRIDFPEHFGQRDGFELERLLQSLTCPQRVALIFRYGEIFLYFLCLDFDGSIAALWPSLAAPEPVFSGTARCEAKTALYMPANST